MFIIFTTNIYRLFNYINVYNIEEEIGYIQSLIVDSPPIVSVNSTYQHIQIYNSEHFGKVFVLDECLQLTERDAPHYNEMLAHVPVMEYIGRQPNTLQEEHLRVLVIGGGDGYVVSELLKHSNIEHIDHVELDEEVIKVAKSHLPWGDAWDNDRVTLVIGDGAKFVADRAMKRYKYHIIVQDSSDPFYYQADGSVVTLPSSVLYGEDHFRNMYRLLHPTEGVLMIQAETYNIPSNLESIKEWRSLLMGIGFNNPRYGTIAISTYPTGQIGFMVSHAKADVEECMADDSECDEGNSDGSTKQFAPMDWKRVQTQFNQLSGSTKYYYPAIHRSSFHLPFSVHKYIYDSEVLD